MNIRLLSTKYCVKKIEEDNIRDVLGGCEGNPFYYSYYNRLPSVELIKEDLEALPPNKAKEDKYYVGFYKEDTLIAVLDLIDGYPDKDIAFIGFFMMNKDFQGKDIGTSIIEECMEYLEKLKFKRVRLAYIKGNNQSKNFWLKNKFEHIGIEDMQERYMAVLLERVI